MAKPLSYDEQQEVLRNFMDAARTGDVKALERQITAGADVNMTDWEGETGIIQASFHDHPKALRLLIGAGGDPDITENQGMTALMIAARRKSLDAAEVLIDGGADLTLRAPSGMTALQLATLHAEKDAAYQPMVALLQAADQRLKDAPARAAQDAIVLQRPLIVGKPLSLRRHSA